MSFQAPLFLIGLVAIPLALLALWAARRRPARYVIRFPAAATLAAVVGRTGRARKIIPPALLCLALAGLVTALARPEATIAVPVERASVMLVTDTSGSMNATDVSPTRLAAAQTAANRFLDRVPKSLQTGLVAYADGPHTVLRPTQDREQVETTRAARCSAEGGTATGDALESALNALGERDKNSPPAAIVLLSDGASKTGRDPAEVAQEARAARRPDLHRRARHRRAASSSRAARSSTSRPTRGAGRGRRDLRRPRVRGRGRRRARRGLRDARLAHRHQEGEARDQRRLRRRRPAAARRRGVHLAALARPAARDARSAGRCR